MKVSRLLVAQVFWSTSRGILGKVHTIGCDGSEGCSWGVAIATLPHHWVKYRHVTPCRSSSSAYSCRQVSTY